MDSAKIRAFSETNCPNTDILATCFPAYRNVVRRCRAKWSMAERSPDCLDRWVEVFSPFSLSGPFALINARWPDETWEQLSTPHLVRQPLSDWLEEDPFWNLSWFAIFFFTSDKVPSVPRICSVAWKGRLLWRSLFILKLPPPFFLSLLLCFVEQIDFFLLFTHSDI